MFVDDFGRRGEWAGGTKWLGYGRCPGSEYVRALTSCSY
jgi:hypothetical protein